MKKTDKQRMEKMRRLKRKNLNKKPGSILLFSVVILSFTYFRLRLRTRISVVTRMTMMTSSAPMQAARISATNKVNNDNNKSC